MQTRERIVAESDYYETQLDFAELEDGAPVGEEQHEKPGKSAQHASPSVGFDVCYYENQVDDCIDQQDRDDAILLTIAIDEEMSTLNIEVADEQGLLDDYCAGKEGGCGESELTEFEQPAQILESGEPLKNDVTSAHISGDAYVPCAAEMLNFAGAVLTTQGIGLTMMAMALATAPISALVFAGTALLLVGAAAWAGSGAIDFKTCAQRVRADP